MSSEGWKPKSFLEDPALDYAALKPAELPIIMSLLDAGTRYNLSRNVHPAYLAVRESRTLLGHSNDLIAKGLMETIETIRPNVKRVGWTRSGKQCMIEEDNGTTVYLEGYTQEVDSIASFVAPLFRSMPGDSLTIEPILEENTATTVLRIPPMLHTMTLVVLALDGWGLSKISLNTDSEFYSIFSAGLVIAVEEGIIGEDEMVSPLRKLEGSSIKLLTRMVKMVAISMEIEVE
jgi:hypothetical protein